MKALLTATAVLLLLSAPAYRSQERVVELYLHENYGSQPYTFSSDVARLPDPIHGEASSLKIRNAEHAWTVLWESENFNRGDDQLWIQGPREITILRIPRQHGDGWNDIITGISFSETGPPWDDSDNRTVCAFKDSCGNGPSRRIPSNPVLVNPIPEHPGWFVRVCPTHNDPELAEINIFLANHNPSDEEKFLWHTWKRGDRTTINLPMNFRYIRDIWLRGEGSPPGKTATMCVGYHNAITWQYQFNRPPVFGQPINRGEDHQPDQNDRARCAC